MSYPIYDYQFRVITIGDGAVGKTALLRYFAEGTFVKDHVETVGADFFTKVIDVEPDVKVKLQLWDTAGQERYRSIIAKYYCQAVAVLLVYDITQRHTFLHLEQWLQEARSHMRKTGVYMFVGQKADKEAERTVSKKEALELANYYSMRYIETSAINGQNVDEAFLVMTQDVLRVMHEGQVSMEDGWNGIRKGCRLRADEQLSCEKRRRCC